MSQQQPVEGEEEGGSEGITWRWITLALVLAFLSLGPSGLIQLCFGLGSFLAGAGLLWYAVTTTPFVKLKCFRRRSGANPSAWSSVDTPTGKLRARDVRGSKVGSGLFGSDMPDTSGRCLGKLNAADLAGSGPIDDPLNEILAFVFRDFVYSWHFRLTHSHSFPKEAEDSLHNFIRRLSEGIQRVDWIPFLTTSLVDDVASHVKLFKKARIKSRQKQESVASDLDGLFFDAEVTMEDNKICRDLVSTIQQEEHNYLQNVSEILLFLLMPDDDFLASPMRVLLREIVANSLLKPTLDLLADPDFINQTVLWVCGGGGSGGSGAAGGGSGGPGVGPSSQWVMSEFGAIAV